MKITPKMKKQIHEIAVEMAGDKWSVRGYEKRIFDFVQDASPMAHSNKEPWLQALRSGEYRKQKGQLADLWDHAQRCCLGVAYGVCGLDFAKYATSQYQELRHPTDPGLPEGFMGLDRNTQDALAELNDNCFTHAQIADLIEEFL